MICTPKIGLDFWGAYHYMTTSLYVLLQGKITPRMTSSKFFIIAQQTCQISSYLKRKMKQKDEIL